MNLGIPYMGSKRKLAGDILAHITNSHTEMTQLYDLFGGGGAISFTAIRDYRFAVHYNELNSHIYYLVEYLKNNKTLEPKFYEWVTREQFFEQCNRTDTDWYSGFVMSCWSFGNKQSSYIYGADIENFKRLGHEVCVNKSMTSMKDLNIDITWLFKIDNIQNRRVAFCNYIEFITKNRFDMQNLESLNFIESLARLQNLQNLQITNLSYENVIITGDNPVIYCDIPYEGTGEYKEGGFNHKLFYEWASDQNLPVYVSEYQSPFERVAAFYHRSSLSATNNKKKTVEGLFWNGKGKPFNFRLL